MAGNKTLIGLRSFLSSVGATAASTFVGIYAVILGAGAIEMGWLQSSFNSISNGAQLLWGKLSDRTGRRILMFQSHNIYVSSIIQQFGHLSNILSEVSNHSIIILSKKQSY